MRQAPTSPVVRESRVLGGEQVLALVLSRLPSAPCPRRYLRILGEHPEPGLTRSQADELIEQLKREKLGGGKGLEPTAPPSPGQLGLLRSLGHRGR